MSKAPQFEPLGDEHVLVDGGETVLRPLATLDPRTGRTAKLIPSVEGDLEVTSLAHADDVTVVATSRGTLAVFSGG